MEESRTKKEYIKPESELVNLEIEQPMLSSSAPDFGEGGRWF